MHALVIVNPELLLAARSPVAIILELDRPGSSCNTRIRSFSVAIRAGINTGDSTRSLVCATCAMDVCHTHNSRPLILVAKMAACINVPEVLGRIVGSDFSTLSIAVSILFALPHKQYK